MSTVIDIRSVSELSFDKNHYSTLKRSTCIDGLFDPVKLNAGDIEQQLNHWRTSDGMTIFIEWVPDQMNEENALELFQKYGLVNNIRFTEKMTDKGKKRSAYITFNHWSMTDECEVHSDIDSIIRAFPGYHMIEFNTFVDKKKQFLRTFSLKCRVDRSEPKRFVPKQRFRQTNNTRQKTLPPQLCRQTNQIPVYMKSTTEERIICLEQQYINLWREILLLKSALHYDIVSGNAFIPR
jgi:hypothetical protein